jgi:hypothetical protein
MDSTWWNAKIECTNGRMLIILLSVLISGIAIGDALAR